MNDPFDDNNQLNADNAYDDSDNAYDDHDNEQVALASAPAGNQASVAIELGAVGAKQVNEQAKQQYAADTKTQTDQHERPAAPTYCINLFNWFPLRLFCFFGGVALVTCAILDFIFNGDAFIQAVIRIYLLFFGFVIMMIEAPTWTCTRFFQLKIFFWFRILSRMWGRAWFYLFITILCFGEFEQENAAEFTIVAGFYLMVISALSFIVSKTAGAKYNRIFVYIAGGSEGEALDGRLMRKWDEIVKLNSEGKVGSFEIVKLATESGRVLSNAERHAIQTYLDESCNGHVSKEDWCKQFMRLKEQKQRFL